MDKSTIALVISFLSLFVAVLGYLYNRSIKHAELRSEYMVRIEYLKIQLDQAKKNISDLIRQTANCDKCQKQYIDILEQIKNIYIRLGRIFQKIENLKWTFSTSKLQLLMSDFYSIKHNVDSICSFINIHYREREINLVNQESNNSNELNG